MYLYTILWTARLNLSILKEINPEYSTEGLLLMLKFQYFGHLMQGTDSLEKTLMLGKIEGSRRNSGQRMRWLDGITNSMDMSFSKLWRLVMEGKPGVPQSVESQRVGHYWPTELNWWPFFTSFHTAMWSPKSQAESQHPPPSFLPENGPWTELRASKATESRTSSFLEDALECFQFCAGINQAASFYKGDKNNRIFESYTEQSSSLDRHGL